jgi:hypothetical protein
MPRAAIGNILYNSLMPPILAGLGWTKLAVGSESTHMPTGDDGDHRRKSRRTNKCFNKLHNRFL